MKCWCCSDLYKGIGLWVVEERNSKKPYVIFEDTAALLLR